MRLSATTGLAVAALWRNKMRSALTTLGIVIGVAAVVMMQSMGEGATAYVGEAISGLGSNMLLVTPGARARTFGGTPLGVPLFTGGDLDAIQHQAHDVSQLAAVNARVLQVIAGSNNRATSVGGVTPGYFAIRQWGPSRGRLPTLEDDRQAAPVCVIGQTVATTLFPDQEAIGKEIRVHAMTCRVIGVLEAKGATFGADRDDILLMPYSTFSRRIFGGDRIAYIFASAASSDQLDDAKDEIVTILHHRRHIQPGEIDDFNVLDPREIQSVLFTVTGVLTLLLAGVAAISLAVGGIGIMNIMLVSVTERTREIGVRLAVGARAGDILVQFLVEATTLSVLGGVIGVGVGLAGAFGVAHLIHVPFVLPGLAVPLAFGVSALVGVAFGVVPARKAARLNPLAALRYE
ncbi:MAG TPA: ABC transporter permease [Gemmatimonadales bacterium]|nr:ABC transporter permease [Gemmatimonadales bacterium]